MFGFKVIVTIVSDVPQTHTHKIKKIFSFHFKGSRAELGSRPSVEGPMDPTGPTEYTEQTLDADSQVVFFFFFLIKSRKVHLCQPPGDNWLHLS